MKTLTTSFIIVLLAVGCLNLYSQDYTLDTDKSEQITWTGYGEVGGYAQEGTLDIKESKVALDQD